MLTQLILKDLRICRLPVLVGITATIGAFASSYLMYGSADLWQRGSAETWASMLQTGSTLSLVAAVISLTMLAGTIIAAERADRSSEFLFCLPPSRAQVLSSKGIVVGTSSVLALCVGGGGSVLASWLGGDGSVDSRFQLSLLDLIPIALVTIGVGWCASARFENTGPSVGLGFASPLVVVAAIQLTRYFFGIPDDDSFNTAYFTSCTVTGLVCLVVGSVYFIRRVEP